jgi:DNA-binding beta-propeller fold protein YncE
MRMVLNNPTATLGLPRSLNPVTNKIYVPTITEAYISVIDGATNAVSSIGAVVGSVRHCDDNSAVPV